MKWYNYLLLFLFLSIYFAGCAKQQPPPEVIVVEKKVPKFSGNTDQDLLEEATTKINIDGIKAVIKSKSNILIASVDYSADSERRGKDNFGKLPVLETLFEEALTSVLTNNGYTVAERNYNILTRLYHETDAEYNIYIGTEDFSQDRYKNFLEVLRYTPPDAQNTQLLSYIFGIFFPYFKYTNDYSIKHPFFMQKDLQDRISIKSADYIFSYKLLEFNVKKYQIPSKDGFPYYRRIAQVKAFVRVTQAQTGETVWSGVVSSEPVIEDTPMAHRNLAEQKDEYRYNFYKLPISTEISK